MIEKRRQQKNRVMRLALILNIMVLILALSEPFIKRKIRQLFNIPNRMVTIHNRVAAAYPLISDPQARSFLERNINYATSLYGKPAIPINRVEIRLSFPTDKQSTLPRDFQRCDLEDIQNGVFTIYVSAQPASDRFNGQLAHEIGHLMNDQIYDLYMEGVCTFFAEHVYQREGLNWDNWRAGLESDPSIHAIMYRMVKDIARVVGDQEIFRMTRCVKFSDMARYRMHIDINAWMSSLSVEKRQTVKSIILSYVPSVQCVRQPESELHFEVPSD
jgi:hypothetical protein